MLKIHVNPYIYLSAGWLDIYMHIHTRVYMKHLFFTNIFSKTPYIAHRYEKYFEISKSGNIGPSMIFVLKSASFQNMMSL